MDYNEYKIDKIKQNTRKKIIISLIVCIVVLAVSVAVVFAVIYSKNKNKNINESDVSLSYEKETDSTFCVVCVNENNKPEFISLIKAQVYNKTFLVSLYSPDKTVNIFDKDKSLSDCYISGGINELLDAVKLIDKNKIDRYVLVTKENLTMIFAQLGHIVTEIEKPVTLTVSEGKVSIPAGKQELDYEEICDYLLNGNNGKDKLDFQCGFICEIMKQYIENADYSESSVLFSDIINYVDTDITVMDYTDNQDIIASFDGAEFSFINTNEKVN